MRTVFRGVAKEVLEEQLEVRPVRLDDQVAWLDDSVIVRPTCRRWNDATDSRTT